MNVALDTTERGRVRLRIEDGGKVAFRTRKMFASRALLFLRKALAGKKPQALAVVNGPGAFSATRNGVAAVNALAYGWGIKAAPITKDEFDSREPLKLKAVSAVRVHYGAEPNITIKK